MRNAPIVIVGGGLAGLTAATTASSAGAPVIVLESGGRLGGRARSSDHEGFRLNLGPHGLHTRGPGTEILRRFGIRPAGKSPQPLRTRLLTGGQLAHPLRRGRGGLGFRGVAQVNRLNRQARDGDPAGTVDDWLRSTLDDPTAVRIAGAIARLGTYADAHDLQAADLAAEGFRGPVRYLDGGWQTPVDDLRAVATSRGAQFRRGACVVHVGPDRPGSGFCVRFADDGELQARAVVLAPGGPDDVLGILPPAVKATLSRQLAGRLPVTMATLDLALARRPDVPSVLGIEEPVYLSVQSDRARIAPAGGAVIHLARFLRPGHPAEPGARHQLEGLLDRFADGWRSQVVHARYLPNITVTHDACLAATGGRRGRIAVDALGIPGMLLAGDWVGPSGILAQASIASGAHAAELALQTRAGGPT
jgi:phytoene dehydrogenase-like protein